MGEIDLESQRMAERKPLRAVNSLISVATKTILIKRIFNYFAAYELVTCNLVRGKRKRRALANVKAVSAVLVESRRFSPTAANRGVARIRTSLRTKVLSRDSRLANSHLTHFRDVLRSETRICAQCARPPTSTLLMCPPRRYMNGRSPTLGGRSCLSNLQLSRVATHLH